jgi:hypothetical protein
VKQQFTVVSNMDRPLGFTKVEASDPSLKVTKVGERVRTAQEGGGTEYTFEVVSEGGLPQGDFNGRIAIETDNEKSPSHYISLRANVMGDFAFSPARVALVTEKGQVTSRRITVNSRKGSPFTVAGVSHDLKAPITFETEMNAEGTEANITATINTAEIEPRSYQGRATINIASQDGAQSSVLVPIILSVRPARPSGAPSTASRLPVQGPAAPPPSTRQ